jgi:hypothetical protein
MKTLFLVKSRIVPNVESLYSLSDNGTFKNETQKTVVDFSYSYDQVIEFFRYRNVEIVEELIASNL